LPGVHTPAPSQRPGRVAVTPLQVGAMQVVAAA
jgi:hypothetical protein